MKKMLLKTVDVENNNGEVEIIVVKAPMNTLLPVVSIQCLISICFESISSKDAITICSTKSTRSPRDIMIAIKVIGVMNRPIFGSFTLRNFRETRH